MINISEQPRLLSELVDSLAQASGGASQLIHSLGDPRWIMIREAVDLLKEGVMSIASFEAKKITLIKPN